MPCSSARTTPLQCAASVSLHGVGSRVPARLGQSPSVLAAASFGGARTWSDGSRPVSLTVGSLTPNSGSSWSAPYRGCHDVRRRPSRCTIRTRHINPKASMHHSELMDVLIKVVSLNAKRLIGRTGLRLQDRDDVHQHLVMDLIRRLPKFDPKRGGIEGFISMVVERCGRKLLRTRRAAKRYAMPASLSAIVVTEEGATELAATISQREYDARRQREPRTKGDQAQLERDVTDVLAGLPANVREFAEMLKHCSVAEAARRLGIPRTTLYAHVQRIRRHFERSGLRDYL